ncbi:SDR family NAD(P)-dependent oxidoreductase [uncultured Parasphingorhabdus sp.]|uniref:SDR family NAD(P)-dependent oxidoreductase n=1 Tax=uncultured Parasphingorhabdus sp. TaxID=2709694 RepID=UPI002AA744C5|nr:SDR family NAD(P)-dependent oxidoreductase [uncultured Parasphingorhabdus sp.]
METELDGSLNHEGRVILITGASSGLGEEFAIALARNGAKIVLGARREDKLSAIVEQIEKKGGQAIAVSLDVTEEASVIAAFDKAEEVYGLVDTVIANAGINEEGFATKISMEKFDAVHAVNSRGVFITVREAGKRLIAAGSDVSERGRIVILSSMGGLNPLPYSVTYSSSKAAAVMMARGFAKEWASFGISVNALCPGYMMTDIVEGWFKTDAGKKMVDDLPRSRMMPVKALLPMINYLTSDEGGYSTGSVIKMDDGQMP